MSLFRGGEFLQKRNRRTGGLAAVLLVLIRLSSGRAAETLWCRSLGVEDGLSQSFVTAVTQDRDGFIWFGTSNGLNRWDGYDFTIYKHAADDPSSLADSVVLTLHVDGEGTLWVGSKGSLDRFEPGANRFRRHENPLRTADGRDHEPITLVTSDLRGRIWFASWAGPRLASLDPATDAMQEHVIAGASRQLITALYADRSGRLWVAMQAAAYDPAPEDGGYRVLVFDRGSELGDGPLPAPRWPFTLDGSGGKVTAIVEDHSGRLWLGRNGGGLLRYDPGNADLQVGLAPAESQRYLPAGKPAVTPGTAELQVGAEALAHGYVRSLAVDPRGSLWVLTQAPQPGATGVLEQLHRVDSDSLAIERITLRQTQVQPGDDARLEQLAVDRSGVLWMSRNSAGLRYADVSSGGFSIYRHGTPSLPGLNGSFVRAICRGRDGTLWVGTPQGLNRIERAPGQVAYSSPSLDGSLKLPDPNVQAIHEDRRGRLWVGTGLGLVVFEMPSGSSRVYRWADGVPGGPSDSRYQVIHEDREGTLWFGASSTGLDEFDPRTGSFRNYPLRPDDPPGTPGRRVHALFSDSRGQLWVGTGGGLARLVSRSGPERQFEWIATDPAALSGVAVLALGESPATPDSLWIGTADRGLCRLELPGGRCQFFHTRNSDLPDDMVYGLLVDRCGRLWMSTNRGLTCYDPATRKFRTYGPKDGLQSSEFNARACYQAPDGEMFFGGVGGLNSFFPEQIADNPHPPTVLVTEVRVLDRHAKDPQTASRLIYRHGMARRTVTLNSAQREIAFEFVALHHADADNNRYQYQLENYDAEQRGPVRDRRVRYTNLDPGPYTFRVKALSSHGVPSAKEAVFSFVILPPFYATTWFRGLTALALAGGALGGYRLRVRHLRRRHRELEREVAHRTAELQRALQTVEHQAERLRELDAAKSKFFANISHEFRTPLTLTLGPLRDIQAGRHGPTTAAMRHELDLAIRNTDRQLELVDQLLTLARLDAGRLTLQCRRQPLNPFLRLAAAPFESPAKRQQVVLQLELPESVVHAVFDEKRLEQAIANLLGNALKFTPAGGRITLRLGAADEGSCTIEVEDDGPGIPANDLPRIFERFHRGAQEEPRSPGTGLGLALTRELVEMHGGTIRAENHPGGGARFTILLKTTEVVPPAFQPAPGADVDVGDTSSPVPPAFQPAPGADVDVGGTSSPVPPVFQAATPEPTGMSAVRFANGRPEPVADSTQPPGPPSEGGLPGPGPETAEGPQIPEDNAAPDGGEEPHSGRPKVLVVDDHPDMRAYLRKHLMPHYQVLEAERGDLGLQTLRAEMPDVVISDVMMPGLDGHALLRAVKADPETDFVPVILVTAKAGPEANLEGLEAGADDYITKPFDAAQLLARVRNLLRSRERLKARYASPSAKPEVPVTEAAGPAPGAALDPARSSASSVLAGKLQAVLERHAAETSFDVDTLARRLGVSRSQLHRRFKEEFDQTPAEMIIKFRLERAAALLTSRAGNVAEIAYAVGFKNVAHFVKRFRERHGQTPAAYAAGAKPKRVLPAAD